MLRTPPLIGRELDLALALEQLKRIERGGSACVLIRGEAGIGKTRLAGELLARAEQVGHRTLVGRADEFDRGIPYALFRDVLARLSLPAGQEAELAGAFQVGLDAAGGAGGAPADAHLSLVFARAVEAFRTLTAGSPTVLFVDDVHLADADSLALLALLVRLADLPMLTLGTARPPLEGPARELGRLCERMAFEGQGAVLDLEPLDRHELHALMGAALGAVPDERVVEVALERSGGNPFFANESVLALQEAGALLVEHGHARLSPEAAALGQTRGAALLSRVFGRDDEALELAKIVSAFGRFDLRHLALAARLTGRAEADLNAIFDRLVREHVLVSDRDAGYEFAHAILRDAVYEDIGPAERRRLHAAIAEELGKGRRRGAPLDVAELATHVAESADPGDDWALDVLLEAARTVSTTAPLLSAEYYGRAAGLLAAGSQRRAAALALRARSLHIGSRPREAAAAAREALPDLPRGPQRQATVALAINGLNIAAHMHEALEVVEEELADGGDHCPLLAQKVHLLLSVGRPEDAGALLPVARAALTDAAPPAQVIALTHLIIYATDAGQDGVAEELLERLEAFADTGPPARRLLAHEAVAISDRRPGVVQSLDRHIAGARALRANPDLPSIGGNLEVAQAYLHMLRGEWDEALEVTRSAGFDLDQRGAALPAHLMRTIECDVLLARGSVDAAGALLREMGDPIEEMRNTSVVLEARRARATGEPQLALELLSEQAQRAARMQTTLRLPELLTELAELLLELERIEEAQTLAAEASSRAGAPTRYEWPLAALYLRGLLWRDAEAAHAYLERAEAEGIASDRSRAKLLLGELDVDPRTHLTQAYREFDALGATPSRRRAAAALRARSLTVPRAAPRTGGTLTDAETQLVLLVRDGLTNRQIASALHYSPKTVEAYLSRIYAKTECGSRVELVRALDTGAIELSA